LEATALLRALTSWARRGRPPRLLEVIESRMLAPNAGLHVVRVAQRHLLVAVGAGVPAVLLELEPGTPSGRGDFRAPEPKQCNDD